MMQGTCRLMAELMYAAGLCVHECVTFRIKDIDLGAHTISVRNRKGGKVGWL
jgi:site-specific recombinase XerD